MNAHFKLFEFDGKQVLIERDSDDDNGEHVVVVTHLDNVRAQIKMGYNENTAGADEAFDKYDIERARLFRDQMEKSFSEPA